MSAIFKNAALDKQFEQSGYVQLPLLGEEDVKRLSALVTGYQKEYQQPFHSTHFSTNEGYKQKVHDLVTEVVFPKLAELVNNYKPVFGNLMVKQAGGNYFMPLHADWTYVNEEAGEHSIAVWIPLVDTTEENGCLGVIAGSHKVMNKIRGPRIEASSSNNDMDWVKAFGKLLPCKAGTAVMYDHALLHYSLPNKSALPRPAINLSVVPEAAEVVHYCIPEGATDIEVYRVDDPQFYQHYNNFQRPQTGVLIKTLPAGTVQWIDERMKNFSAVNEEKKSFFSRLFGV